MNEHISVILPSAVSYTSEIHLCLQSVLVPVRTGKVLTLIIKAAQEIHSVVITGYGKTRHIVHHVALEPLTVVGLKCLCLRRQRIIIKICMDISFVCKELVQIIFGIHHPLRISEKGYDIVRMLCLQRVQFVKGHIKFRRPPGVQYHDIRL